MQRLKRKTIGILGGMGPEATADIYLKIIKIFQKYGAIFDKDYPAMVIYSLPIPDVVKKIEDRNLTKSMILSAVKKMESDGADFIILACNTINIFLMDIRTSVSIPVVGIGEEVKKIVRNRYGTVGLFSTATTSEFNVFDRELESAGIKVIKPDTDSQKTLTDIILNIISGKKLEGDKNRLENIIKKLSSYGAEAIILGCTELPLIVNTPYFGGIEIIDTNNVLAKAAVERSIN